MWIAARLWPVLLCVACAGIASAAPTFQDNLDVPAVKSDLVAHRLLNGIAQAGARIVAVGQRGHIVYSDDQGKTWVQAAVPVSSDLTAVHFPTPKKGWAVGHDGVVLASKDGGASWVKQLDGRALGKLLTDYYAQPSPGILVSGEKLARLQSDAMRIADEGPDKPFLSVWFENENDGYVAGVFNLIFHTRDGGASWTPCLDRTENPGGLHLLALGAVGGELYAVGEQGLVLKLDRGSQTFRALDTGYKGTLFGVGGHGQSVIAYGLRGHAFRSFDAGSHWQKIETGVAATLTGATTLADGRIVLVSQGGQVLLPNADGSAYAPVAGLRVAGAAGVVSPTPGTLVIAGVKGIDVKTLAP